MPQFYNPNYYNYQQPQFSTAVTPAYMQAQPQQVSTGFAWVQGEAAAKAYAVTPGTTMMLMDTEKSCDLYEIGRPVWSPAGDAGSVPCNQRRI